MRGGDTVEEPSIHPLNMLVTTPSNRHECELRTVDFYRRELEDK